MVMIAALYVDARGPYLLFPDVSAWTIGNDATKYPGPYPVIAHPPCGHWGRYSHKCHDDGHTGPIAVEQVRKFGGILEHPKDSKLWKHCGIPSPGPLRSKDKWGGYTIQVEQGDWGHKAQKKTWLYIVGIPFSNLPAMPARRGKPAQYGKTRGMLEKMSKTQRHLTPPAFAEWLVNAVSRADLPW